MGKNEGFLIGTMFAILTDDNCELMINRFEGRNEKISA